MDYEELRSIQRMERNSPKPTELPSEFYADLKALISNSHAEYEKSGGAQELKNFENIIKVARDIFERREQKLVLKALHSVRTNEPADGAIGFEKNVLENVVKLLRDGRNNFEKMLVFEPKAVPKGEPAPKPDNEINTTLVRILRRIPCFVSSEMREYGPFEANDIVRLPKREADALSAKNFIELI